MSRLEQDGSCPDDGAGAKERSLGKSGQNRPPKETSFHPVNRVSLQEVARERFADLLRVSWPERSDRAVARDSAAWLGVSERTVLNWLACEVSVPFEIVFAIGCRVGVFAVMDVMTRGEGRQTVLNRIVQGVRRVVAK